MGASPPGTQAMRRRAHFSMQTRPRKGPQAGSMLQVLSHQSSPKTHFSIGRLPQERGSWHWPPRRPRAPTPLLYQENKPTLGTSSRGN